MNREHIARGEVDLLMTRQEAIECAYLIPGWMWPKELGWLYDHLRASRLHLEIGCYAGKSLFATAAAMDGGRIIAVDPLGCLALGAAWDEAVLTATMGEIHRRTNTRVEFWRMGSVEAMRRAAQEGLSFDSVFIDGSHHYAEVKADIEGWSPLVRPGGLLCGHDYWPRDPGVMDAVQEAFRGGFDVANGARIWFTRAAEQ